MRKLLSLLLVSAVVVSSFVFTAPPAEASAPTGTPEIQIQAGDGHSNPQQCAGGTWVGSDDGVTQEGTGEQDCLRIRIQNGNPATVYTRDFRVCLTLNGNGTQKCTAWASDIAFGENQSDMLDGGNQFNSAKLHIDARALPANVEGITNVSAGIQLTWKSDNQACHQYRSNGMQWSNSGSASSWALGDRNDDDPGCGRIGLRVTRLMQPNAAFLGETVPDTMAPGATYSGAHITMKNTGLVWNSDQFTRTQGDCSAFHPTTVNQTCYEQYRAVSSGFVLKRQDTNAITAPDTLPYERMVTRTYRSYQRCDLAMRPDAKRRSLAEWFVGTAHAARPDDAPPPEPPCEPGIDVIPTDSPTSDVWTDQAVDFPITVTAGTQSTELRYQMKRISDGRLFGDVAVIPITINGGQGIGLVCQNATQVVTAGQAASFNVSVSSVGGFAGAVGVNVTNGLPAGASSPGASTTLAASSTASALVPVFTTPQTPAGTSTLTFTATAAGVPPQTCQSDLVVRSNAATITVSPTEAEVQIGGQMQYRALYDSDGTSGPVRPFDVTVPAAWYADGTYANAHGSGLLQGIASGTTPVTATYGGIVGSAMLSVRDAGGPTLTIVPTGYTLDVGETVQYQAMYDADGGGPGGAADITAQAQWDADAPFCSSLGSGRYRGISAGTATVWATYNGLAATARCRVSGSGGGASLRLDPTSRQIEVGQNASFSAYYDSDGASGGSREQNVTSQAVWSTSALGQALEGIHSAFDGGAAIEDTGGRADASGGVTAQGSNRGSSGNASLTQILANLGNGVFRGLRLGTAPVTATYNGLSASGSVSVIPAGTSCTFTASPSTLFIPPPRSTTLRWSCQQPTTCTVTKVTGGSQVIATGGQTGTGQHMPPYTTQYHLSCAGGVEQDVTVRVFDVTTRIEILPQ